jgi:hypothetical protein
VFVLGRGSKVLKKLVRSLVAGIAVATGLGLAAGLVGGVLGRSPASAACWTLIVVGTGVLAVSAMLLLGKSPSPNRPPGDEPDPAKRDLTTGHPGQGPLTEFRQAAAYATSPERESLADTGFNLVAVGAAILLAGFVISAIFRV